VTDREPRSPAATMRGPDDLRAWAQAKYRSGRKDWLGHDDLGRNLTWAYPLRPPSEAVVGADPGRAAAWVSTWQRFAAPAGVSLEWVDRRWKSFGAQRLPDRVHVTGAPALATLAGSAAAWGRLSQAAGRLRQAWPHTPLGEALRGLAGDLGTLGAAELERLVNVVEWFVEHPESGLLARQVAVPGVDTKWLERHRRPVGRLVAALTAGGGLGLGKDPERFRVRVLDPTLGPAPHDFAAPLGTLAELDWHPTWVLVCENLQCLPPLPAWPGVVAVHGRGLSAPSLAAVGWCRSSRLLYWGDLDTWGFQILSTVRQALPQTESVLMDAATLERFADLAIPEPQPCGDEIGYLTGAETAALAALRRHTWRLEQERLPWPAVEVALAERLGPPFA